MSSPTVATMSSLLTPSLPGCTTSFESSHTCKTRSPSCHVKLSPSVGSSGSARVRSPMPPESGSKPSDLVPMPPESRSNPSNLVSMPPGRPGETLPSATINDSTNAGSAERAVGVDGRGSVVVDGCGSVVDDGRGPVVDDGRGSVVDDGRGSVVDDGRGPAVDGGGSVVVGPNTASATALVPTLGSRAATLRARSPPATSPAG